MEFWLELIEGRMGGKEVETVAIDSFSDHVHCGDDGSGAWSQENVFLKIANLSMFILLVAIIQYGEKLTVQRRKGITADF